MADTKGGPGGVAAPRSEAEGDKLRIPLAGGTLPEGAHHLERIATGRIQAAVQDEVAGWPGVTAVPHRFGGVEFRLGRVELGHIHGDYLADLPFPRAVRDELVAAGRAGPHHVLPESGWVSRRIRSPGEVGEVVALFRLNYDRILRRRPQGA